MNAVATTTIAHNLFPFNWRNATRNHEIVRLQSFEGLKGELRGKNRLFHGKGLLFSF